MDKCSLKKSSNGIYGYSVDSVEELQNYALEELGIVYAYDDNVGQIKAAVRKALANIGEKYDNRQLQTIAKVIEDLLNDDWSPEVQNGEREGNGFSFISDYLPPEGIYNALSSKYRSTVKTRTDEAILQDPDESENPTSKKSQFIDDVWGNNVRAKNKFKQEVTNLLIDTFIINRKKGKLVTTIAEANQNVRDYKQQIFKEIKKYLQDDLGTEVDDLYDDEGNYTGVLDDTSIRRVLTAKLGTWDAAKIASNQNEKAYDIFKKYFILKNYDNLVKLFLDKAVIIKPGTENTISNEDTYTFATKNDAVITSWRTNDDIQLEQEIGALAQSLINSTPFLQYNNDTETGQYIKFQDFYHIITKIKDLGFNANAANLVYDSTNNNYEKMFNSLSSVDTALIKGKTLRQLISKIRENPALYSRLVFECLVRNETDLKTLDFTEDDKHKLYSLYKGIFATNGNSIRAIQFKENYKAQNYYNLISQVTDSINSVKFLQYNMQDNVTNTRALRDFSVENVQRRITDNIAYTNARSVVEPKMAELSKAIIELKNSNDAFNGIQFSLGGKRLKIQVTTETNVPSIWLDNVNIPIEQLNKVDDVLKGELLKFADSQLALNLNNVDFKDALNIYLPNNVISNLVQLASRVLFNKYITYAKGQNTAGKSNFQGLFEGIYGKDNVLLPKYNNQTLEMNLYSDADTSILQRIAQAKALIGGDMNKATIKDADGKMLSQQTLSRLLGNITAQQDWINEFNFSEKQNPFSKMAVFNPKVFKGIYTTRELKSNTIGNKAQTKFTVAEFIQGTFLYDFVGGLIAQKDYDGSKVIGNGVVTFMPSVNSDKNTINRMAIDLNATVESSNPILNGRTYRSLNYQEIQQVICEQLGHYYASQVYNINKDFDKLQTWLSTIKNIHVKISTENNFEALNTYCYNELTGKYNTADQLYEWTRDYNNTHTDKIVLIDQTHFIKNNDDGSIKFNSTIYALNNRYNNKYRLNEFMELKNKEVLKALLDENTEIRLIDGTTSTTKNYLLTNYPDWVKHGKMVYAKINGNPIMSKQDIEKLNLNIKDSHTWTDVELHPLLKQYNALDLLFTQEFMYSTVGSHVNHPAKVNIKAPIVYINEDVNSEDPYIADTSNYQWLKKQANEQNFVLITNDRQVFLDNIKDFNAVYLSKPDLELESIAKANGINILHKNYTDLDWKAQLLDNECAEEASRFKAQDKRNVSLTAAMHEFQLNQIDGIPNTYNMAILSDLHSDVYTIQADSDQATNFDGATFVNPWVVIWENNSLNGDKAGINKKQFVHFFDRATGTGGIIKTAGFGITNDKARQYQFYRDMAYNMTHFNWKDQNGNQLIMPKNETQNGILRDFNGDDVNYGDIYFTKAGKNYRRIVQDYLGNNTYEVIDCEVDENGNSITKEDPNQVVCNSNYDIWQMFGGWNSLEIKDGKLQGSEHSIELTARACNAYGTKKEGVAKVETAVDVFQPMKHSDIHYSPTIGAVKQGAANINPTSCYTGKHDLNFMQVEMRQAGIQLDKEHHADNEHLSLMTQVISAACSMGYTQQDATNLYQSLYNLTKSSTKEFRSSLGSLVSTTSDDFEAAITSTIIKSLINTSTTDGDSLQIIAQNVLRTIHDKKLLDINKDNYKQIDANIPYSDAAISNKIVSMLTSTLTKNGIKAHMPGVLAVLNPAQEIIKFYQIPIKDEKGKDIINPDGSTKYKKVTLAQIEREYHTEDAMSVLQQLQDKQEFIPLNRDIDDNVISVPQIKIGSKYLVTYTDGEQDINGNLVQKEKIIHITMPNRTESDIETVNYNGKIYLQQRMGYRKLLDYLNTMDDNRIIGIKNFTLGGQDLDSYDITFNDINGNSWQLSDLDIVQDYFTAREQKDSRNLILYLLDKYDYKQQFQQQLIKEFSESNLSKEFKESLIANLANNFDTYFTDSKGIYAQFFQKYGLKFLNIQMQKQLESLRTDKTDKSRQVLIDDQLITVDSDSIKTTNYGLVMPKVFKNAFNLEEFDQVEDILNDPEFFTKKLLKKLYTKVQNYYIGDDAFYNYHVELKRNTGDHIYIRRGLAHADLTNEIQWFKQVDADGNVYRVDSDGNIIQRMFSVDDKIYTDYEGNQIIVVGDDVYKDTKGTVVPKNRIKATPNGLFIDENTGEEVKLESPLQFYIDNTDFSILNVNSLCSNAEFGDILNTLSHCKSQYARNFAGNFEEKVINKKKTWVTKNSKEDWDDYMAKYENIEELYNDGSNAYIIQKLKREGSRMMTSFIKALDIVAARIPAQSQASFMPMHIESFENPDTNNAYVNIFQFYLQGSDLDIDAVSLQTFAINHNGIYEGHSPYFNLDSIKLLKASETNIPFPTGEKLQENVIEHSKDTTMIQLLEQYEKRLFGIKGKHGQENALLQIDWSRDGERVNVEVNNSTIENIELLGKLLNNIKSWEYKPNDAISAQRFNDVMFGDGGTYLNTDIYTKITNAVKDTINRHNTYINDMSKTKRDQILKNNAVTALFNIISNPVNLREAQSSVDVLTKTAKALAKQSEKNKIQATFTPGNFISKLQSINENMTGKDGIAISATALKSFFATTFANNTILNNGTATDAVTLMCNVPIGGKIYHGIANVYADYTRFANSTDVSEETKEKLISYLQSQQWESDAANEASAFLSLSTDNAKELALAKLNAGTITLGMYLYGLSIGVPVETLYKVMTSPIAFRLAEITKGDVFNGESSQFSILGALNYIKTGPKLNIFNNIDLTKYKGILRPVALLEQAILDHKAFGKLDIKHLYRDLASKSNAITGLEELRNACEKYKGTLSDSVYTMYEALYNQAIDKLETYVNDLIMYNNAGTYKTVYGESKITDDLETLAYGAAEYKRLGQILRLNQSINTNPIDLYMQVSRIENLIVDRVKQIIAKDKDSYRKRLGLDKSIISTLKDKKIDLEKFLTDISYQREIIADYDAIKQTFNPLKILVTNPNYKGYVESLLIAHKGMQNKQLKYRFLTEIVSKYIDSHKIIVDRLKKQVYKNADAFINYKLRQTWMQESGLTFTISGTSKNNDTYAFINGEIKPLYCNKTIQLGTDVGDANFKLWVERTLIPKLKADTNLSNNIFIQNLAPVITTNTNIGIPSISYGLGGINMLPQTDYEREILDANKDGFNKLSSWQGCIITDAKGKAFHIQQLLFYYSLICNNGKLGPTSLHKIFEDYLNEDVAANYKEFIAKKEAEGKEFVDGEKEESKFYKMLKDTVTDEWLAPLSSPYTGGTDIFKYKNTNENRVYLYKQEQSNDSEENYEEGQDMYYFDLPPESEDKNTSINGYVKQESKALISSDYNFFTNPTNINFESVNKVQKGTLSNYNIYYEYDKNGNPVLVSISKDIAKEFKKKMDALVDANGKKLKGVLPFQTQRVDGKMKNIVDEDQIEQFINDINNGCGK